MAIGVRILSNNLSGATANVIFNPLTGGTIDLGEQTIPFNYLNENPYGVYLVNVPEYDFTYELSVNESLVISGLTFGFISKLVGNNNYGAATLDFNDLTAQIIDLNVDYTGWYIQDLYPLTNSGYAYYFQNENTCDLQWVIFTDALGNILESYQTNCNCAYDYDDLGGKWTTFVDYGNGIIKYSNGQNVYTLTADSATQMFGIYTDYDGITKNGNLVYGVIDGPSGLATNYIVNGSELTEFNSYAYSAYNNNQMFTYFDGDFIAELKELTTNNYESLKFYNDTDGTLLQTLDLTGQTYNNYQIRFYGDNKMVGLFYNNGDSGVDYLIFQYDGNTNTLITTTHPRGTNYPYFNFSSMSNFYPNPGGSEAFVIKLYHIVGYNNLGDVVDYCDLIYMLSGDTDFTLYTFQDSGTGDKTIQYWANTSDIIENACDNGDGYISILVINSSGVTISSTDILRSGDGGVNTWYVGNGFVTMTYTNNDYTGCTLFYINNDGVISDTIAGIEFPSNYQYQSDSNFNVYQFSNEMGTDYYINEMSDVFQIGNPLANSGSTDIYFSQNHFKPNFIGTGVLLNFEYNTKECNILTSTGYTNTFSLPYNQDYDIIVGDDKFMYIFIDLSGNTNIHLYDFNGNLLNSLRTEHTSFYNIRACGNGFVLTINENGQYYIYLVSETEILQSILTDDNSYYTFNDYVWWD